MRNDERSSINTEGCDAKGEKKARGQTERKRHEARGQTERKKAERPDGQSERNTNTQILENTRSAIKKYTERKRGDLSVKCVL